MYVCARKVTLPTAISSNENGCLNLISHMHKSLFLTHDLTIVSSQASPVQVLFPV